MENEKTIRIEIDDLENRNHGENQYIVEADMGTSFAEGKMC